MDERVQPGTIEGDITQRELKAVVQYAMKNRVPMMMEMDYDIPNLKETQFREADAMLEYVL